MNDATGYSFLSPVSKAISERGLNIRFSVTDSHDYREKKRCTLIQSRIDLLNEHLPHITDEADFARAKRVLSYQKQLLSDPSCRYSIVVNQAIMP